MLDSRERVICSSSEPLFRGTDQQIKGILSSVLLLYDKIENEGKLEEFLISRSPCIKRMNYLNFRFQIILTGKEFIFTILKYLSYFVTEN